METIKNFEEFKNIILSYRTNKDLVANLLSENFNLEKTIQEKIEIEQQLQVLFSQPKSDENNKKIAELQAERDKLIDLIYTGDFIWGFSLEDFSKMDLSKIPIEKLMHIPFSTATKWPEKSKLPKGFDPEKLVAEAKNYKGLGVEQLHKHGITGKGVKVAYIDKKLDLSHEEFKDRKIDFVNIQQNPNLDFHGYSVLSRLMGKNIGIAPDVGCVYYATDGTESGQFADYIGSELKNEFAALKDVLKRVKAGEEIVAVGLSASIPYHIDLYTNGDMRKKDELLKRYSQLSKELENYGTVIFSANEFWNNFTYAYKKDCQKPNDDLDNYVSNVPKPNAVAVIDADKLTPLPYTTDGYKYENNFGCASWSIPQVLGLFCLAKQVDANLTMDEFAEIAQKTANKPNKYGTRLINAVELVKEVKFRLENQHGV